jgi:hypothetical protein
MPYKIGNMMMVLKIKWIEKDKKSKRSFVKTIWGLGIPWPKEVLGTSTSDL